MSYFDDNEDRHIYGRRKSYPPMSGDEDDEPRQPKCNRCGSTEVRWRQQGGRWVLFSLRPGVEHVCPIADDFDALD